jgi:transposase
LTRSRSPEQQSGSRASPGRSDERIYREIKLLIDHREALVAQRTRSQQRLRWHLHQLDPTYEVPLRRLDRATQLERVAFDQELVALTNEVAPALLELPGCAAITAAKLLAAIGPIERFKTDAQLARHGGVAPLEASSGRTQRHLDRSGNRQLNAALYRIAITRSRCHAPARAYLERKRSEGKSRREALRCLKRQLARVVFNTLKASPALT